MPEFPRDDSAETGPPRNRSRRRDAAAPPDSADAATATRRRLCTGLRFWTACRRKACRRAHACAGDPHRCFAEMWPRMPQDFKVRCRGAIRARASGLTVAEALARGEAELAQWSRFAASDAPGRTTPDVTMPAAGPLPRLRGL